MHLWPPTAPGNRVVTAALVLAVHALAALVMLSGREDRDRRPQEPRELEGVWITLHLADLREQQPEPAERQSTPPSPSPSPSPPREQALVQPQPRTAITLPPPVDTGPVPQDDSSTTPGDTAPAAPIDWYGQARELAKDYTGDEPATFSPPPKVMRACKPRESSFWVKPAEPKQIKPSWEDATRAPRGSVMLAGRRVGVVGIGIPLGGPKPEPNKHLFDDMVAGKTPESSVPSPHVCD